MDRTHIVRRGCIAVQAVRCDRCGRMVKHPDRYLAVSEPDEKAEAEEPKLKRYCVKCCEELGFASYRTEKGEKVLTLLETNE